MHIELCEIQDASAWGIPSFSPFCLKIHLALQIAGLPYTRKLGAMPSAHKSHNPTGQVPILLVDGRPIPDSTAILQWITETAPDKIQAHAEDWLWEELADTSLNGFLVAARWADDRNWPVTKKAYFSTMPAPLQWFIPNRLRANVIANLQARDIWRAGPADCWKRFDRLLDQLEERCPTQGFWMGPQISVADVAIFGQLHGLRTPLTQPQAEKLLSHIKLTEYLNRLNALGM